MKSTRKKTIEADWGEFLGHSDILSEPPEGYSTVEQIISEHDNMWCYSSVQKKLHDGYKAGRIDRVAVKERGGRRKFYYKIK